ncbi:MAG TPA: AAA family ATPase [Candidatus Binataceae bacterium]
MAGLGKKSEGGRGTLRVQLVGNADQHRTEVRIALVALGDPPLQIVELTPHSNGSSAIPADVTMVVFNGNDDAELAYLQAQAAAPGHPVLFALLHDRSPELMKRVLRAGADELLFLPLDAGDAHRALFKISETRRREERVEGGQICSFVSLIGGTGVTSLAGNLALALRYALDKKVALVDLDLQTSGLSVFLNLDPERTIMALTEGAKKIDSIQLESALCKHPSGAYLLAAPKRIEDSELVNDAAIGAILEMMRELFDYVIVDCGTHIDANTVAAWERSQHLFYVLDQSIGAARCAWRFVDLCGRLGLSGVEPNFILSRHASHHPISEEQLSHTLAKAFYARIPRDEKVLDRVQLSAQDLWQVAPNSALARTVEEIARRLDSPETVENDSANSLVSKLLFAIGARS